MRTIHTLTVLYDEREDRLHLAVRCNDGAEQGLWLTQRLGSQLVRVLSKRARDQVLAAHQSEPQPAAESEAAQPGSLVATEVVPVELQASSPHGLVHTVNIVRQENGTLHLIFRWEQDEALVLPLDSQALLRVVEILRLRFQTAGWSLEPEAPARQPADWGPGSSVPPNTTLH